MFTSTFCITIVTKVGFYYGCHDVTGAIAKTEKNKQVLDKLQVERERGITVKAQTASLFYNHQGQKYLLNLIDTPVSTQLGKRSWKKCV